ncbi:MAG: DUF262 domain-containing protein [Candidatus Falkowbacteria bacterium]|nr:DUF262 domain-containing protein [Candidatus Falkowbacteria bacterium]
MENISKPKLKRKILGIPVAKLIDDWIYRIDLDADYQREKIWSRKNQEELLDSIIQNIDIPKIYLAEVKKGEQFDYECIDGKQRMSTLLNFFKPDDNTDSLVVRIAGEKYTYKQLKKELPSLAKKIEDFELTFVIYPELEDEFIRQIFSRLQLGIRLNSGELLKMDMGSMRNFIYTEMGKDAPFFRNTKLSEKRFSRQFTLAQICINSFSYNNNGSFVRARYDDLVDFFKERNDVSKNDENLARIRKVLEIMDEDFGDNATSISSRAIAVTAYLFIENLYTKQNRSLISEFVKFYLQLLSEIKKNIELVGKYKKPENSFILEEFQKYISQASVESSSILRRHNFISKAFEYYLNQKTKGEIINSK